jgi:hypothetical protein
MKYLLVCGLVLAVAGGANAAFLTEDWTVLNSGINARSVGYSKHDDVVTIGEGVANGQTFAFDGATGAALSPIPPKLPTTGLTIDGSLGFFGGLTSDASNPVPEYYGMASNSTNPLLKVWPSLTGTASEVNYNGQFARNQFYVGSRLVTVGSADGGPIQILDPDGVGDYQVTYSMGDPAGDRGGKGGATMAQDSSMVWGIEGLNSPSTLNMISQWSYNGGTDSYDFDGYIDYQALGIGRSIDVAVDEADNVMFVIDFDNDQVVALELGSAATGDETAIGTFAIAVDTTFYMGLEVDIHENALIWGARHTNPDTGAADFAFGKLTYVPEPSALVLLGLGGLALIRRR